MTEGEKRGSLDFVVVAVVDVDVFAVEDTAALGSVVEEGWVVL